MHFRVVQFHWFNGLAFAALKEGNLSVSSATGSVLERNLKSQRDLINRAMADLTNITTGLPHTDLFSLAGLIEEVKRAADLAAKVRGCAISVAPVNKRLSIGRRVYPRWFGFSSG
jgi:hypothetical protein